MLRARQPLVQHKAGVGRYTSLIDWEQFLALLTSGNFPAKGLPMARGGRGLPPEFYRDGEMVRGSVIGPAMTVGASLSAYGIEPLIPAFAALCGAIAERTGDHVSAGLIATTGKGRAIDLHYDVEDIVILQIEGSKRWLVQPDSAPFPLPRMDKLPNPPETKPLIDVVLAPGDFMFVPTGYRYCCENQDGLSLHMGILFQPLSAPQAMNLLSKKMLEDERNRVPLRFDPAEPQAEEARPKALMIEQIEALSLAELSARHRAPRS